MALFFAAALLFLSDSFRPAWCSISFTDQFLLKDVYKRQVLAKQMLALIGQRQVFEQQKIHFLRKVEKEDLTASRVYANKFRGAVEKLGY